MPILRLKEIRDMPPEERIKKLGEFKTEVLRLKTMIRAGGTVENTSRIRELRRTIARMLTIENEQKAETRKTKTKKEKKK
jgi:large subunit ribosomal protein L29